MSRRVSKAVIPGFFAAVILLTFLGRRWPLALADDANAAMVLPSPERAALKETSPSKAIAVSTKSSSFDAGKLFTFAKRVSSQSEPIRPLAIAYQFPVLPGTGEWGRRVVSETPWNLCEIPPDVLTNLTNAALVATCLRYPMRSDLYAFDTNAKGLQVEIGRFNGFRELLSRNRVASLLKDDYLTINVDGFGKPITNDNLGFLDLGFKSTLLLRHEILSRLTRADAQELCEKALILQADVRRRYGRSASEEPAARLAASLMYRGVEIRPDVGNFDSSKIFSAANPYSGPEQELGKKTLDSLYEIGKHLRH